MALEPDPRPLIGEPLALDLLNTEKVADGAPFDLFATADGLARWLDAVGIDAPDDEVVRRSLVEARAAIRGVVTSGSAALQRERERVNGVLAHGRVAVAIDHDNTVTRSVDVSADAWRPAVLAVMSLVELLETAPDRIRRCDHPNCVLWFLDTTRNGSRRWCSMAGCGNRAKAQRHYERTRSRHA